MIQQFYFKMYIYIIVTTVSNVNLILKKEHTLNEKV